MQSSRATVFAGFQFCNSCVSTARLAVAAIPLLRDEPYAGVRSVSVPRLPPEGGHEGPEKDVAALRGEACLAPLEIGHMDGWARPEAVLTSERPSRPKAVGAFDKKNAELDIAVDAAHIGYNASIKAIAKAGTPNTGACACTR